MMRSIVIAGLLLALGPSAASAGGINLAWNDCAGAGGVVNRNFACNTNTGTNDLYISFDPPVDIPDLRGANPLIDLQSASATLPIWWQLKNAGSCRPSSLQATATIHGTCPDAWEGMAYAGIWHYDVTENTPSMPSNRARIVCSVGHVFAVALPVHAGTEYFCLLVRIDNAQTVGPTCGGCLEPVCLVLNEVLVGSDNSGDFRITNPILGTYATWQGGAIGGAGCPGATPSLNRTWGQIKSAYR